MQPSLPSRSSHAGIESTAATKTSSYDDDDGDEDDDARAPPASTAARYLSPAQKAPPDPGTMGANMSILLDSPELGAMAAVRASMGEDGAPSEATDDDDVIDNALHPTAAIAMALEASQNAVAVVASAEAAMHSSENAILNAFASPLPEYAPPVAAPEAAPDTTHDDTQLAASALAKLALFAQWRRADLVALCDSLPRREPRRYETIYREGQAASAFFVVVSGAIAVTTTTPRARRPRPAASRPPSPRPPRRRRRRRGDRRAA